MSEEELIKSLKEQLEMVIKENQRLLEKHFEQDSEIMYLNANYNRCKEENEKLHSIIKEARKLTKERIEETKEISYVEMSSEAYIKEQQELLEILDKVEENK